MQENDLRLSDGRTLHVYDTGSGDLPVFWNHGTPNLGAPPAPLLTESERLGVRWISFDRPGYGGSSPAPGRTMASVAGDAAAVADELGIARFAVAGYSGGGSYALGCAAALGDRVTAAVTLAAIAPYGVQGLDWFDGMVPSGVASLRAALGGREVKAAHEASGVEYDPEFTKDDFALFEGEWGWLGSVASHGLDAGPYGLIDDDISYVTPWGCDPTTIEAPILLLHGERDRIIPASHGAWLAAHCPTAELRLAPGASHFTIFDEIGVVLPWLAGHR
ncbi:alpha/beta fold hydrolase [Kribbella monticola]|uniref:alpha/beta fold hydrolase n=1 Tax=Kribbella monticola TaxID=2185285 RepID=UPI000DD2E1C9|nr:alpha/beta hydrolase [Kribbella monticola]